MIRNLVTSTLILFLFELVDCSAQNYSRYVDPFIGTGGHGHTYPGATMPHGMVQLSPDTRLEGWDGCSGYHYSDSFIYGFSHTHLSGTGVGDFCDILVMPMMGEPSPDNNKYGSAFQHKNEKASPGYYSVLLDDDNILAELTTTTRTGLHRYTFNRPGNSNIILDLKHRDKVIQSTLKITGATTIEGMRRSEGWAQDQHIYFVMEFSKPFNTSGIWKNGVAVNSRHEEALDLKAFFSFNTSAKEQILVKVGISLVDIEGARKNLSVELKGWDFDRVRKSAVRSWETELKKIEVSGGSLSQMKTFYTALYHTIIVPNINMDVDHRYRGRDNKIHTASDFTNYSVFSLWDTYRAAHPLYTIIDRARTLDYLKTFLAQYSEGGRLPVWELASNETDCMIGYHSVPVIVDAAVKGIDKFDKKLALEAMIKSATWDHYGLSAYMDHSYLEEDDENESVSKTLEYAYDDWCIATFAKLIGDDEQYKIYIKRAQSYKNILDKRSGFMRPRKNGNWVTPFDPKEVNNDFTEANSWQYSFYVPQDISGYTLLLGGKKRLEEKLDSLFTESSQTTGRQQSDITGLIGQYAHGNEPSHHIAYLYTLAGAPHKTQKMVHRIMKEMYHDAPDGLAGNEDCGQMSAWYVLSALGFYQVTPGTTDYIIGTPLFKKAVINLENGKKFSITAPNVSTRNLYVRGMSINGSKGSKAAISYADIMNGGELVYDMSSSPSDFGRYEILVTAITDELIVINPVIEGGAISFENIKQVSMISPLAGTMIYYTLNGKSPGTNDILYTSPFTINSTTTIKAIAVDMSGKWSKTTTSKFIRRSHNFQVISTSPFEPQYSGGGKAAVIDEIRGSTNWRKGNWQGYQHNDVDIVIDLVAAKKVSGVTVGLLQDTRAWIVMPKRIVVEISMDGISFTEIARKENLLPVQDLNVETLDVQFDFPERQAKLVRVKAIQYGKLPAWHEGAGGDTHIFIDEIKIRCE